MDQMADQGRPEFPAMSGHDVRDVQKRASAVRRRVGLVSLPGYAGLSSFARKVWNGLVLGGAALSLAGCLGTLSTLEPAGRVAGSLATLGWSVIAASAVLMILMLGLFAIIAWRPQWGTGVPARNRVVRGGLLLPALVLPPLAFVALVAGERLIASDPVPRIEAEAARWHWTFRYPDHGGAQTVDILHLPSAQAVDMVITSRDVVHSFWVPRLAGKIDAVPGRVQVLRLIAGAPGPLEGQCAEVCGVNHTQMRFDVRVHDPAELAAALADPQLAATAP